MAEVLQFPFPFFAPALDAVPSEEPLNTLELSDPEARLAALDIQRSWIVEAPAGSGKTGLLIQRFLKLLAQAEVERPNEILAITFTRKAAGELRTRILGELAAAVRADLLPLSAGEFERITRQLALAVISRDRDRTWRLLESPHQLNIRTIDSFCSELAGRVPMLSGAAGRREPAADAEPLYQEAARRAIRELAGPDPQLRAALSCVLLHRDGQISDSVSLIADMLANREQWGELIPLDANDLEEHILDGPVRQRLEATLERTVCRALTRAARAMDADLLAELSRFAARLSQEPGSNGKVSPVAVCAGLPHVPGTSAEHLDRWLALIGLLLTRDGSWRTSASGHHLGFELPRPDSEWLRHLLAHLRENDARSPGLRQALCALRCLPPSRYPDDQWRVAKALFRILRRAWAELLVLFAERGVCDFTELTLTARQLLASEAAHASLLHVPGTQLTHLLVDEMQDTSSGHYKLLELLTRHWDGRTQTLFLVGDPKQSIYSFRQARVERFLRTQTDGRLGDVPLGALRLSANFRSQATLVDAFNHTFSLVLPSLDEQSDSEQGKTQVPFVAATPTRPAGASPALHWHLRIDSRQDANDDPDADDAPAPTAEQDALLIRNIIEQATNRLVPLHGKRDAPKIAVLARNRAHLAPIIAELRGRAGRPPIPFRAVEIEVLSETQEVLDLLALTRALLHPGDRLAWLAVLHSPVCGLGLADLLTLTGEGRDAEETATVAHLVQSRAHLLSQSGQQLLQRAWRVLAPAQASLGRTLFSTTVERAWRSLGADASLRPDEITNAHRFLSLLRELEAGSEPLSLGLLNRRLGKLYAEPFSGPAVVELMTIHKAKGLEWDLVLIPALERGSGPSRHELLKWLEFDREDGAEAEVILAPISSKGDDSSALSKWLSGLQKERETEEAKRLFYVACTRAREELHLFGVCKRKQGGEVYAHQHDSLLRAGWPAAEPIAARLTSSDLPAEVQPSPVAMFPAPSHAEPLALAASADSLEHAEAPSAETQSAPLLGRLPLDFDPLRRFRRESGPQLPYPPASTLRSGASFARPEGSFGARAFGNVVHRFLELAADRLAAGASAGQLQAEVPGWRPRIFTAFRSEGVPVALCQRDTDRTLHALHATLNSSEGRWLLSPHPGAQSERGLHLRPDAGMEAAVRSLRADRVFLAGADPLSTGSHTHLWIVDFKTTEPGGRPLPRFLEAEKLKYLPQMEAYAHASAAAGGESLPIMLALFYPSLTQLLYWPSTPFGASQHIVSATDTVPR